MFKFLIKCVLLFFAAASVFSQTEQGLLTNEPFWRQAMGGVILSLPDVQVQSAVVALDGGNIRAFSAAGTLLWDYYARGRISPFVTRSREGTSYFSRTNGIFIAVNRAGRELWRHNLGAPLSANVVVGWDSRLFVPTEKKISCYTASGNLLWTINFESSFSLAPKLNRDGGIIFALENNEVYRVDPFGKSTKWTLSKKPVVLLPVDPQPDSNGQQILALFSDGTMEIIGQFEEWFVSAQGTALSVPLPRLPSAPLAAVSRGNNIAAVLNDGVVFCVSLDERKILWNGDSHIRELVRNGRRPELEAEMIFDERGIYVLSKDGAAGFSHDGRRYWFTFLQNTTAIPAFGNDGVLYSGGRDWVLYAYKVEDRTLPERSSIYGPLPDGSYGTGLPQSIFMPNIPLFESEIRAKLDQINSAIRAGRVGENELAWTTFLMMTADSQAPIQLRVSALQMLGQIGSRETISWLTNIFRKETDPLLKSTAIAAIGTIGVDPDGHAINLFLNTVTHGGAQTAQVLTAIASATGALCRFSGPPLSQTGIRILLLLSADNMPPIVSRQARSELTSLR